MKKRFTLIELLAVMVILAIILAIAIPSISNIIENSRLNAYKSNEKMLSKAASNYYIINSQIIPSEVGEIKKININNLQIEDYINEIVDVEDKNIECEGYVLLKRTSETTHEFEPYLKCRDNYTIDGYTIHAFTEVGDSTFEVLDF
jgi:prepilin-type N-terminal cleavage/methylation domain-containing protein